VFFFCFVFFFGLLIFFFFFFFFPPPHPPQLRYIVFRNYYCAALTVKHRPEGSTTWHTLVHDYTMMQDPHSEDDAQEWHTVVLPRTDHRQALLAVSNLRFYLNQPSPNWRHFGLKDIKCYSAQGSGES
jgi:hypothetical protein